MGIHEPHKYRNKSNYAYNLDSGTENFLIRFAIG